MHTLQENGCADVQIELCYEGVPFEVYIGSEKFVVERVNAFYDWVVEMGEPNDSEGDITRLEHAKDVVSYTEQFFNIYTATYRGPV